MSHKLIKLIADSGIQFHNFDIEISEDFNRENKINYIEEFHDEKEIIWYERVLKNRSDDEWFRLSELKDKGYIDKNNDFTKDYNVNNLSKINEDNILYNPNIKTVVKHFANKWIPLPFFKNNNINKDIFGPIDWVRCMISFTEKNIIKCSLAVDTNCNENVLSPSISSNYNDNIHTISNNEDIILSFLDERKGCDWVLEYLQDNINIQSEDSSLIHVAAYQIFIKLLLRNNCPSIQILPKTKGSINVDMVIDVGNSTTCALLFESSDKDVFHFNKVKKLNIQDLSKPYLSYNESFSSKMVFSEVNFNSDIPNENNKFIWPSLVRIGEEANRLINKSNIELSLDREIKSYNSSPKRYLWDDQLSDKNWEYLNLDMSTPKYIDLPGLTNNLQINGDLVKSKDDIMGSSPKYSRRSLMKFLFLEIFINALKQINSTHFRQEHGNVETSRSLRNIVITCPTSMIQNEQYGLRIAASDALEILSRNGFDISTTNIYPSLKDLKRPISETEEKNDWIYDEATCSQLVYLYGLIVKKFQNNPDKVFDIFGKKNIDNINELTIASIDIGGGTTDLMIASYKYNQENLTTEICPNPLFWETFDLAGDDLLQEMIQEIIIEDKYQKKNGGRIENLLKDKYPNEKPSEKLNSFFGENSNNIGYKGRVMRKNFLNQVSIPIINLYLDHANNKQDRKLTYHDIFHENKPCDDLLEYFYNHFGFHLEEIEWTLSSRNIEKIVSSVFSKLINQVSHVIKSFDTDILILSGRTFNLRSLENIVEKAQPVLPNRIVNMNNYWIGKWFPFSDENGFVGDQKSILSVGCLIALLSGKFNQLGNFRIDTNLLINNLKSNSNFIGKIKNGIINDVSINENQEESEIKITEFPFRIGTKQLNSKNYPSRYLYNLEINREYLNEKHKYDNRKVDDAIQRIKESMPLKVIISRDLDNSKEKLIINEIQDSEFNNLSKKLFIFQANTLKDIDGYWLDHGEFILKI